MGNKMKKLICALLASAMLISSVGVVSFADTPAADTTGVTAAETAAPTEAPEASETPAVTEAPEATAAPEATEAPAVTEAPAAESSSYDSDNYYKKSLALCSSLGIISGYEDGSVKPDSNVTRAEMASIVLRMLALSSQSKYKNVFTDVTESHWAADQIQTAMEAGIISGMGDGTFVPDGDVTYAQVLVMIVNALNYSYEAELSGGWPNGYLQQADALGVTKSVEGSTDVPSKRGEVIKMVYNALLTDYKDIVSYTGNMPVYKAEKSLAETKFDVIEGKGVLLGTNKTALTTTDIQEDQIEIRSNDEENGVLYNCIVTGLEDYLAQKVTFYYRENQGLMPEVLAIANDASKSDSYEINDVKDIESITGFEANDGKIKISGVGRTRDCKDATIIYNGQVLTNKQYDSLRSNAKDADLIRFGEDINDMLTPEVGSIKLIDSDKNGVYDVVFVDSYETMIVTTAGTDKLTGKVSAATEENIEATEAITITLDDTVDRTVTVTKAGAEAKLRNLKKNDVASIRRSLDDTVVDIDVSGESITGSVASINKRFNASKATIAGERYDVANIAVGDLKTGAQSVFYFDSFNRVAYIESSGSGRLSSGEKYAWLVRGYESEDGEDYIIELMTEDGKVSSYTINGKLDFWGPKDAEATTLSSSDAISKMKELTTINETTGATPFISVSGSSLLAIKLVKFKANSNNSITRLYCAVDKNVLSKAGVDVDKTSAVIVDTTSKKGSTLVGGLTGGYTITDEMIQIDAPIPTKTGKYKEMTDSSNYKVAKVNSASYNVRESGPAFDYVVAEMSGKNPALLIKFVDNPNNAVNLGDLDTVATDTAVMVVDEIDSLVDEEDNPIYTIHGFVNGTETSVTTSETSAFGDMTGYSSKKYTYKLLWTGKDTDKKLTDFLKTGDMLVCRDGQYLLRYASAEDMLEALYEENGDLKPKGKYSRVGDQLSTETRNYFYFGKLVESEVGDVTWVQINSGSLHDVSLDPSMLMSTVEINVRTKSITVDEEGSTISDLVNYDETEGLGDYLLARFANKGALQELVVYRFVK